jgi:F1F0 ATPase subunit 2
MTYLVSLRIVLYALLGALIGAAYLEALEWNVQLYALRGVGWNALLIHLARFGVAGAAFTLCARRGAAPLLASFAGFLVMRTLSLNRSTLALGRTR